LGTDFFKRGFNAPEVQSFDFYFWRKPSGREDEMSHYAGDLTPQETWQALQGDEQAVLVDVRSAAEWDFVGVCDLRALGRRQYFIAWQQYPQMLVNESFVSEFKALDLPLQTPVYFICRSGQRSRNAAMAIAAAGFKKCYNVAEGFEGDPDSQMHRGQINGWKAAGLPWVQK
tara:strand:+ start:1375 stop:1890 length:516 start_codon:yes stop_codon:yes gene_type:complete